MQRGVMCVQRCKGQSLSTSSSAACIDTVNISLNFSVFVDCASTENG